MSSIKIKLVKSAIKRPADQKATIQALGFRRLNQVVEKEVTPQIMGMVNKVKHLIQVVEQ
ncbi:MAG: 50S ribosomal protein L30 [Crocinitomicaceae bacterium]|jgi:large subunit ribosomal protein L30|nr:50S ribosomal protein L30 [Crocinitomicaceae bacterium]MDP4723970.1 50S ribosomal protein L30 [Crocinitomicaceae bacterium]MDP4739349.1 50S ribosomal protein L30 [Crocinitomicaceae bacterium]MDP4798558.1 50S ribosomal protein L30 [Crocinitomicaceae bacterium]MDP4806970.1 50S ribosomal protein L30 [Crocinitomicaceae bacterium]